MWNGKTTGRKDQVIFGKIKQLDPRTAKVESHRQIKDKSVDQTHSWSIPQSLATFPYVMLLLWHCKRKKKEMVSEKKVEKALQRNERKEGGERSGGHLISLTHTSLYHFTHTKPKGYTSLFFCKEGTTECPKKRRKRRRESSTKTSSEKPPLKPSIPHPY